MNTVDVVMEDASLYGLAVNTHRCHKVRKDHCMADADPGNVAKNISLAELSKVAFT